MTLETKLIPTEKEEELTRLLEESGLSKNKIIKISELRKKKGKIYYRLLKESKNLRGDSDVSSLLTSLGFKTYYSHDIQSSFKQELMEMYTPEKVEAFFKDPKSFPLPTHTHLKKKSEYGARYFTRRLTYLHNGHKEIPHLEKIIQEIGTGLGYPYLHVYLRGGVVYEDFSIEEIKKILVDMYYNGEDISRTALDEYAHLPLGQEEPKRFILPWLFIHTDKNRSSKKKVPKTQGGIIDAISTITGIDQNSFSIKYSGKMRKEISVIYENFIKLLLEITKIHDPEGKNQTKSFRKTYPLPLAQVYPKDKARENLKITFKEKEGHTLADCIVVGENDQNLLVEVKGYNYYVASNMKAIKEFLNQPLYWPSAEKDIQRKALIILSRNYVFQKFKGELKDTDIEVIDPSECREQIKIALDQVKDYPKDNVYSLQTILDGLDLLIESPHLLLRETHKPRLSFLEQTIKELLDFYQKQSALFQEELYPRDIEIYSKKGEIIETGSGTYQHFTISLKELIADKKLREILPIDTINFIKTNIAKIPEDTLFLDLETTGLSRESQIILIGMGYKKGDDFVFELPFARNPWEEKAVINYFCNFAKENHYKTITTFNGKTFDIPLLENRAIAHLMKEKEFFGYVRKNHEDMYHVIRKAGLKKSLKSLKLKEIGYRLEGKPTEDIDGCNVPKIYDEWLKDGNPEQIVKNLEHNLRDIIILAGVYLQYHPTNGVNYKKD